MFDDTRLQKAVLAEMDWDPSVPAGQIGVIVCSLEPTRDVKTPVRRVEGCRYYNDKVHSAAFVTPEFARRVIEDGEHAPPPTVASGDGKSPVERQKKKILLLGSGYVARPFAEYILRYAEYELTVGEWARSVMR